MKKSYLGVGVENVAVLTLMLLDETQYIVTKLAAMFYDISE